MSAVVLAYPSVLDAAVSVANAEVPVNVGLILKTALPVPVSSVSAEMRFALDGVARKVPTFEPRPVIPPTATALAVKVSDTLVSVIQLVHETVPVMVGEESVRLSLMYESPMVVEAAVPPVVFTTRTPPVVVAKKSLLNCAFSAVRPVVLAFVVDARVKFKFVPESAVVLA